MNPLAEALGAADPFRAVAELSPREVFAEGTGKAKAGASSGESEVRALYHGAHPNVAKWGDEAHYYGKVAHLADKKGKNVRVRVDAHETAAAAHAHVRELAKKHGHAHLEKWHSRAHSYHVSKAAAAKADHDKAVGEAAGAPLSAVLAEMKKETSGFDPDVEAIPGASRRAFDFSAAIHHSGTASSEPKQHQRAIDHHVSAAAKAGDMLKGRHAQAIAGHQRLIRFLRRKAKPSEMAAEATDAEIRAARIKGRVAMKDVRRSALATNRPIERTPTDVFDRLAAARKKFSGVQKSMEAREPHPLPPVDGAKSVTHHQKGRAWRYDKTLKAGA